MLKSPPNNYAFIDSQNVYLAIRDIGWKVDWYKFRVYLRENYDVQNAFLFIGYIKSNSALYESLKDAGFICVFKPVSFNNGVMKGNVDAELVLRTMHEINNFDKAVIVTGDGDFSCLVTYLKDRNKLKTLLAPNRNRYSALLKYSAKKDISFMNDLSHLIG